MKWYGKRTPEAVLSRMIEDSSYLTELREEWRSEAADAGNGR